jgi:hypothetical protein
MIRIFIAALAISLGLSGGVLAQGTAKSKSVLHALVASQFPDNTAGAITPQIMRNVMNDFIESWQQFPGLSVQTGTTYAVVITDQGKLLIFNNAAPIAMSVPQAVGTFGIGFNVFVQNRGAGTLTITPTGSTIDGVASVTLDQDEGAWIVSDGANYHTWSPTLIPAVLSVTTLNATTVNATNFNGGTFNAPAGTAANPSIKFPSAGLGFNADPNRVNLAINSAQAFSWMYDGSLYHGGLAEGIGTTFPACAMDTTGGGILRCYKGIFSQPGDVAEVSYYAAAGSPSAATPWTGSSNGQQMSLSYTTLLAPSDDNPLNYILANSYRLINPFRLSGASPFSVSRYMPSVSAYASGQTWQIYWVAASPASPQININPGTGALGNRSIMRADCVTAPGAGFWNAGAEITVVDNGAVLCANAASDNAAGRTDRNGFMNPNWARSTNHGTRMAQAPTQTGRGASWTIQTTKPNESVLRDRTWVSTIGATVAGGLGSFEDAASISGITPEDYYPGPMVNAATDCYYSGIYFAGLCGPHNSFNTAGWAAMSVVASDTARWAALGIRKSGAPNVGWDTALDHATDRILQQGVWPSGSSVNVSGVASQNGLCRITTATPHGLSRRDVVQVASVGGATEANGYWTAWPVTTTVFDALGTICVNAYTAGGTVTRAVRTTYGYAQPQTGIQGIGGDSGGESMRINRTASQVTRWAVSGATTGNPPTLTAEGETNTGAIIQSSGTGQFRFRTNNGDAMRIIGSTASKVNYIEVDGAATTNTPSLSAAGSDSNISMLVRGQGTGGVNIRGTQTNDAAATTIVGETITSSVASGSAVALATGTPSNVTSISLTAGDWDVYQQAYFNPAATTNVALWFSSISTVSATLDTTVGNYILQREGRVVGGDFGGYTVGPVRVSLSATTTYFMVVRGDFTVSTMSAFGKITARRRR